MPLVSTYWDRSPGALVFNAPYQDSLTSTSVGSNVANTIPQDWLPLTTAVKVQKVAVSFSGIASLAGTYAFNIVYNQLQTPGTPGAEAPPAANDNAFTGSTPGSSTVTGTGVCTNPAVDGNSLFASDILFTTTNFPGATTSQGGIGIFIPTNYDALYPSGPYALTTSGGTLPQEGYFTLRVTTSTGGISNIRARLLMEPVTMSQSIARTSTAYTITPGVDY